MNAEPKLEHCLSFIHTELRPAGAAPHHPLAAAGWRAVTISRQSGSGGHVVGELLADRLKAASLTDNRPWTVFDRNLVEKVLEDNQLPAGIAKFMPEDRVSEIDDVLEDVCGLHPPLSTLVAKTARTILHLAEMGHVVLIGRGANLVTRNMNSVFHVRLVGSLEKRVEFIQECRLLSKAAAREFVLTEDRGRTRYVRKYFGQDIDDPLLYHLVINTDLIGHKPAAKLIAETMLSVPPASN